jgi:predicted secreted hydrolase
MNHVVLPAADGVLPDEPVQWWYWTGHLVAGTRRFGFEACFFAFNAESLLGQRLRDRLQGSSLFDRIVVDLMSHHGFQMVDIALTDLATGGYDGHVLFALGMPPVMPGQYALQLSFPPGHRAAASGGNGQDKLQLDGGTWTLDLALSTNEATHPPALHYGGTRHDYSFGGYTFYYSRMNQTARGRLTLDGHSFDVSGSAWFDRQYGDLNAAVHEGWQWFAIQLTDDTQIMLFDLTGAPVETYGALVKGGRYTRLGPDDFSVEVLDHWTSPVSRIRYPSRWRLVIGARRLIVTPTPADQELREMHPFPTYWEGDCLVAEDGGGEVGQAYVELQGFTPVTP